MRAPQHEGGQPWIILDQRPLQRSLTQDEPNRVLALGDPGCVIQAPAFGRT
jgi:hypothetical protein